MRHDVDLLLLWSYSAIWVRVNMKLQIVMQNRTTPNRKHHRCVSSRLRDKSGLQPMVCHEVAFSAVIIGVIIFRNLGCYQ